MQNRRDSKSRLNSAAHQMLTNNISLRENNESSKRPDSQRKIEELQLELQQKEITLAALQRNYEGMSRFYKEEKGKSSEWVEKVSALEKENFNLRSKIQTFEVQKQKALQDLEKTQEELIKLLKGYEEVRSLKTENVSIKILLEKKKKENDENFNKIENFRNEIESIKRLKIDLEAQTKNQKIQIEIMEKDKNKWVKEYEEYKANNIILENKYAEALNEIDRITNESNKKNISGASNEQTIVMLKQQLNAERSELSSVRKKNAELLEVVESLKDQLETSQSKLSNNDMALTDTIKNLKSKLFSSQNEISNLNQKLENFNILEKKLTNSEFLTKSLTDELENKNQELENWKNEAKGLTNNLNDVLKTSEKTKKQLEEEIKAENLKKKEISEERQQVIELLNKKDNEYKQYLESKEKSLSDCKARIDFFSKSLEYYTIENKKLKDDLLATTHSYSFTNNQLQQSIENNSKLQNEIQKLNEELENYKQRLSEEISQKSKFQNLTEEVNNQILSYKQKIEGLTNDLENLKLLKTEQDNQINSIILENSGLSKNLEEKDSALALFLIESNKFQKNIELLERDNKALIESKLKLVSDLQKFNKMIENLSKQLEDTKEEVKKLKENNDKLLSQISEKDLEISKLQNNLLIEKNNFKNAVEDNKNITKRLQNAWDEKEKLKNNENETQKKMKSLNEREKSIGKALERLENALNSLETNLSCHSCFNALENAVLCLPCGHISCGNCKPTDQCKECEYDIKQTVNISIFDGLNGKIMYKKQAIDDMKHLLNS